MKQKLLGKNLNELKEIAKELSLPSFTATQIAQWLYQKRVRDISEMTNLSKVAREKLSELYEVGHTQYAHSFKSVDGTKKYLFPVGEGERFIETVMIPDGERSTVCVSCQVGCKMGCKFCMTGRQGFHGHLDAAQILSQFMDIDEGEVLTNAVFMGMGEPLDNYDNISRTIDVLTSSWGFGWSPKRITLSTVGIIPMLERFLKESKCHLAVSLHNPFGVQRADLMPMQKPYPIEEVVRLIKKFDFTGQRRVSFEYIVFSGVNDSKAHSDELVRMLKGLECRVNLIRFHAIPNSPLKTTSDKEMESFKDRLNSQGLLTTIRASRGEDIFAACGLLSGEKSKK